jgi:hypothetical protein
MKCENCESEHDGSYASGRFCSLKCSRGFSTKAKRKEINGKVSKKLSISRGGPCMTIFLCLSCEKKYERAKRASKFCSKSCAMRYMSNNATISTRKILSDTAKKTGLGGNRNRSAFGWYDSPIAGRVFLESSWEHKVAQELDVNNQTWCRPSALNWIDKFEKTHKYYPDFYLIEYGIYLDPKNEYLQLCDKEKIDAVIAQNRVKILVLNKHELTWEKISLLLNIPVV